MKYVSISGAVAAGKTTMLNRLLAALGERATAHEENPEHNPFIRAYYEDPVRWSFHSQMAFLTLYFEDDGWRGATRDFYFFDRCLVENLVIARYRLEQGDLTESEYGVIERMAKGLESLMPPIDRYVYLRCSVETLMAHARARGRDYESGVDRAYCEKQKRLYDAWAETLPKDRVMVVDMDREPDLDAILAFLEADA